MSAVSGWMAAVGWLAGCGAVRDPANTVNGVQVVAIETTPPEPGPFDALEVRAWVADAHDRGADTLVWLCTPVDGQCVESVPPGSVGLPLSQWVRVGRARPTFATTVAWPLFASIAADVVDLPDDVRGSLLVWALACVPGVCPVIDQVAADPAAGSEAWQLVAEALADPATWLEALPRHQVSLAVKVVPVDLGRDPSDREDGTSGIPVPFLPGDTGGERPPNRAPALVPDADYPEDGAVTVLGFSDPDGDELMMRPFVTAGGVVAQERGDELWVMRQDPVVPGREGVVYVVAEDGRGGTAVWSDHPALGPCGQEGSSVAVGLADGARLPMQPEAGSYRIEVPWTLRTRAPTATWSVSVEVDGERMEGPASIGLVPLDLEACTLSQTARLPVPGVSSDDQACAALGRIVTVRVEGATYDGTVREDFAVEVRGVLVAGTDALRTYCLAL